MGTKGSPSSLLRQPEVLKKKIVKLPLLFSEENVRFVGFLAMAYNS